MFAADERTSGFVNECNNTNISLCTEVNNMRSEFLVYRNDIRMRPYSADESREFFLQADTKDNLQLIGKLGRLLMTVPASATSQERQFFALKCRSADVQNKSKVQTLDRDAFFDAWKYQAH